MKKDSAKIYDIRIQDFTPFVGYFFYRYRNWSNWKKIPESQKTSYIRKDMLISGGLFVADFLSGIALIKGLEFLVK